MREAHAPKTAEPPPSLWEACALLCPCLLWLRRASATDAAGTAPQSAYNSLLKRETSEIPEAVVNAALYGQPKG